ADSTRRSKKLAAGTAVRARPRSGRASLLTPATAARAAKAGNGGLRSFGVEGAPVRRNPCPKESEASLSGIWCPESKGRGGANGSAQMWEQLTPADFGRARRVSNRRRTETLNRQKRELVELLAKHASEIELLDEKHAQIDELEGLIVSFLGDCHIAVRAHDKA